LVCALGGEEEYAEIVVTNFNNLVPGGGLTAHELAGGHTLARHIGQTESQLANRLASEPKKTVSSFTDRAVAEQAISDTIKANQLTIEAWLNANPTTNLSIEYTASNPVGISLRRGSTSAVPAYSVLVVLKPAPSSSTKYYILTAYIKP